MKVLITGAGGVVGSHMIEILYKKGIDVLGTYFTPTTDITEIDNNIKMVECDVRDKEKLNSIIRQFQPDRIFHLAAQSRPPVSWEKPYETMDINAGGTINILEIVKSMRNEIEGYDPVVVVACSSAAYGETISLKPDGEKVNEHDELLPLSPYGVSKAAQDLLSFQYNRNFGIKTIRARIFNTTGPRKLLDITGDLTSRAVMLEKHGGNDIRVGNLDTIRAIMDVRDLISALWLLSEKGVPGEAYNICNDKTIVMSDVIKTIEKVMNIKLNKVVDQALLRPSDEKLYVGDITKIQKTTGWKPTHSYEETVRNCIAYWRKVLK